LNDVIIPEAAVVGRSAVHILSLMAMSLPRGLREFTSPVGANESGARKNGLAVNNADEGVEVGIFP
jgi:hypothetical protein